MYHIASEFILLFMVSPKVLELSFLKGVGPREKVQREIRRCDFIALPASGTFSCLRT